VTKDSEKVTECKIFFFNTLFLVVLKKLKDNELSNKFQSGNSTGDLIRLILEEGKADSYGELYSRFQPKVYQKCLTLLKDKLLAQEFSNDILVKAFENLPRMKNTSAFSSWLYVMATNYCIDYLRNKKKLHYPNWNRENELPDIIDESGESLPELNYDDLMEVLEKVHPEEKALILMKYQDDLSLREIGKSLRITEDAAKMRLKRARSRLIYLYKKEFLNE
jgi:RNA polymerase sigma factor (sigma-70 family)